jgi:hypothetical protein
MITKRVLILANSQKYHQRCVAGREVLDWSDGALRLGHWVRPVSDHGQGELTLGERSAQGRGDVRVLDVVDMPLRGWANEPFQPENWRIAQARSWVYVDTAAAAAALPHSVEDPPDLWLEPGESSASASPAGLAAGRQGQSLYLIRPEKFRLRFSLPSQWTKARQRAGFSYQGQEYDLALTDPIVTDCYADRIPLPGKPPAEFTLPCGDSCILCVSLGGEYQGKRYKLVATIFENC